MAEAPRPSLQALSFVFVDNRVFPPPQDFLSCAHLRGMADLSSAVGRGREGPRSLLGHVRTELYWKEPFKTVLDWKPPHAR